MQVNIKYGRGEIGVDVPDSNLVSILTSQNFPPIEDPNQAVWNALETPIDSPPLSEIAKNRKSATVVISDITRPVPNKIILPPILQIIEEQVVPRDEIRILIATGIHRPNEGDELLEMVGRQIVENHQILNHFSQQPETLINLGQTQNGTPVLLNRLYVESDLKIISALIEPTPDGRIFRWAKSNLPRSCKHRHNENHAWPRDTGTPKGNGWNSRRQSIPQRSNGDSTYGWC
ncbi:hypothetical protein CMK22_17015 [Candidatus Poribacteria bacterium]|nr:hypothetical protein [Candidatus Poribacteria bacterium]